MDPLLTALEQPRASSRITINVNVPSQESIPPVNTPEPLPGSSSTQLSSDITEPKQSDDKEKPTPDEPCGSNEDFQRDVEQSEEIKKICEQIIEKIPENACGVHPSQRKREIIRINSKCPPRHATIRHRLPSPEPDIVERLTVIKPAQDIIDIIIEKPSMPPPCMIERTEQEKPLSPLIRHNVICVPPSAKCPPGTKRYEDLPQAIRQAATSAVPAASTTTLPSANSPFQLASSIAPMLSSFAAPFTLYSRQMPEIVPQTDYEVPVTIHLAAKPPSGQQEETKTNVQPQQQQTSSKIESQTETDKSEYKSHYIWPHTFK